MPKVRPLTEKQRREQREQGMKDRLRGQMRVVCGALGMERQELARAMGISLPTLRARIDDPGTMRVSELMRLEEAARAAGLPFYFAIVREGSA